MHKIASKKLMKYYNNQICCFESNFPTENVSTKIDFSERDIIDTANNQLMYENA